MKKLTYIITLLSDAEPGTGVGSELINQHIPRDTQYRPLVPATHIKGLLREELLKMEHFDSLEDLACRCLGRGDDETFDSNAPFVNESLCQISDALLQEEGDNKRKGNQNSDYITRTAIDETCGQVKQGSLRTTERIVKGTRFEGTIYLAGNGDSREELAILAGLLSIQAIGSGRNRGIGKVLIAIKEKKDIQPGDLLRNLPKTSPYTLPNVSEKHITQIDQSQNSRKTLRLTFTAQEPICCPEKPLSANAIESGFAISSSAVRGWLISRMAKEYGPELASAMYESNLLQTWPLLPCGVIGEENYGFPVRVSITHKTAKLVSEGDVLTNGNVEDKPIWEVQETEGNNPLKASEGVLLIDKSGGVSLWKSGSMPRVSSAHGVHNDPKMKDGRNLFQMVSMAPMVWSGVVILPEIWANLLIESVKNNDQASFGRYRSTRGLGHIQVEDCFDQDVGLPWSKTDHQDIVIIQSPILLPLQANKQITANEEFEQLIKKEWSKLFADDSIEVCAISTNIGIRFGWNRSGLGAMTGKGQRQKACRVVLPGSIFQLYQKQDGVSKEDIRQPEVRKKFQEFLNNKGIDQNIRKLIQGGLGGGIERGFGQVSVHPGMAKKILPPKPNYNKLVQKESKKDEAAVVQLILTLWQKNREQLPSASQISAVAQRAAIDLAEAKKYLQHQIKGRTAKIWATWEGATIKTIEQLLGGKDPATVQMGLKLLMDLIKYDNKIRETTNDYQK